MSGAEHVRSRVLTLAYVTLGVALTEAVVSLGAGHLTNSVALLGFGFDSVVESFSAFVIIWRFRHTDIESQAAERRAVRLVGVSFFILAAYVLYEAAEALVAGKGPDRSPVGLGIAAASIGVMLWLYYAKSSLAAAIGSKSLAADARQSLACSLLSVGVFVGLGLVWLAGWWWADSLVAVAAAVLLVREGRMAVRSGDLCC
jgi:divalent metal cation (Fe/Co/Zn/Cd) transporter